MPAGLGREEPQVFLFPAVQLSRPKVPPGPVAFSRHQIFPQIRSIPFLAAAEHFLL